MSSSIRISKDKKVETLEDFADILFTRSKSYRHYAVKILEAIKDGSINEDTLQNISKKLEIPQTTLYYIIHDLKKKGIIEKRGAITFSSKFLYRLTEIMDFYSQLSSKVNPYQELINTYKEILKAKGLEVEVNLRH
jgi:DNA-binding Lrp family transcriptional regulator